MKYWLSICSLLIFNIFAWWQIWQIQFDSKPVELYFLDVGQGDSQLIQLGDAQILIDGGPDATILKNLEKILPAGDRYLDLVILTHPQLDHFGGLIDVLERYEVGRFLDNGREGKARAYKNLPLADLRLVEGDKIKYKDFEIKILSPSPENLKSAELNDTAIIALLEGPNFKALYTGDAGENIEERIRKKYQIKADILKVGHHGSRFSSSAKFLKEIRPKIAIIEVGRNSYGHPHPAVINRLAQTGSLIYTTLENGLIKITPEKEVGNLKIFAEK